MGFIKRMRANLREAKNLQEICEQNLELPKGMLKTWRHADLYVLSLAIFERKTNEVMSDRAVTNAIIERRFDMSTSDALERMRSFRQLAELDRVKPFEGL